MCTCSPESQLHGIHLKRGGQQKEGGVCPPLLCPCEALPEVRPSILERRDIVEVAPKEGQEDDLRLEYISCEERLREVD